MSALAAYRKLAPFTADELVEAINKVLAVRGKPDFAKRTLRFYIAQRVASPPLGSAKFARYGYEHFLCILAARALRDQGMKIDRIVVEVDEIKRGRTDRMEKMVEEWLAQERPFAGTSYVKEVVAAYTTDPGRDSSGIGVAVQRIPLTKNCFLEIFSDSDPKKELTQAAKELEKLLNSL
ncbi:MAG TPA: hypothetical protein PLO61_04795 [Fimbriimonadaceae bacterium]|nr:hypothetical protein [Fimbriimonadaceae bacterium]HRJ32538.1 hypothetical protein [Fimbriimonadaceae bacterium]